MFSKFGIRTYTPPETGQLPSIQSEESQIQERRESNPSSVGHQQESRSPIRAPEVRRGDKDGHHERHDIDESRAGRAQTEENDRPAKIQSELGDVPAQTRRPAWRCRGAPCQPAGNGDHRVKNGPDWSEEPIRWCKTRFGEPLVPRPHGRGRYQTPQGCHQETCTEESSKWNPLTTTLGGKALYPAHPDDRGL